MHKYFLTITCFFIFFISRAQKLSIANEKENIFYTGIDNPVSIAVENTACNSLIVKVNNGRITGKNCSYTFYSDSAGAATITVYKKNNGKLKEIGHNAFRVKRIPLPPFLIGSGKARMKVPEIAAQQYVRTDYDFNDGVYGIEQFTVCIISGDTCKFAERINFGNKISDEISHEFSQLKPNDFVIFKNILISRPGEAHVKLEPVMITIIE